VCVSTLGVLTRKILNREAVIIKIKLRKYHETSAAKPVVRSKLEGTLDPDEFARETSERPEAESGETLPAVDVSSTDPVSPPLLPLELDEELSASDAR